MKIRSLLSIVFTVYGVSFASSSQADIGLCQVEGRSGYEIAWKACEPLEVKNGWCGNVPETDKASVLIIGMFYQSGDDEYSGTRFFNKTSSEFGKGLAPSMVVGCYAQDDAVDAIKEIVNDFRDNFEIVPLI